MKKKKVSKKRTKKQVSKEEKSIPTLKLRTESSIASDFAVKGYKKFDKIVKSIVLFGSVAKQESVVGSDIDIIIIIDDVAVHWNPELITWYREELDRILQANPYKKSLHINTIKLSVWWRDLMRGDPTVINMVRYGEEIIDAGGFFAPIKYLLLKGEIKATPEAIYSCLQRVPMHLYKSRMAGLNTIEGLYWAMVDSAHAALIAAHISPPSPEHIPGELNVNFVSPGMLKPKFVQYYKDLLVLHKSIAHGKTTIIKGADIDMWYNKADEFTQEMTQLVNQLI